MDQCIDDESIFDDAFNSNIKFEKCNGTEVKVNGKNIPEAIKTFTLIEDIPEILLRNIKKKKFTRPTPIQKYSIPIILSGRDLMATAQTGSGKTIAFVIPIIQKLIMDPVTLVKDRNHCEPQVIIIVPTRELAVQMKITISRLTRNTGIFSFACYGGIKVSYQKDQILRGCHILVATIGRLKSFVQHGVITFSSVRIFVLNEVDRMLYDDMKSEIDCILNHFSMPPVMNRQTIMMSATLPEKTRHLAQFYLKKDYLLLTVGIVSSTSMNIKQTFYMVNKFEKRNMLTEILKKDSAGTIVFVKRKWVVDYLVTYLNKNNIPSVPLHSNHLQHHRKIALNNFHDKKTNVLVATDLASRGLDFKCVNHVINFDMPPKIEEYVQRIGRKGKPATQAISTSFFDPNEDYSLVVPLIKTLALANQEIPDWLVKLRQDAKCNDANNVLDQFVGLDIRHVNNSNDDCEEW
ncbi:ATP-dependent RNA helicase vasa-like [Rhopalosiphum maidis]|uniref:ATP-dependent RNA helicase vasa-like n=1 Tax=Rhopalosiphum maidis TaxID=43146 RepID=UPI000EFF70C7|nr:ATP-dependent RNA helicase vasa-like [Rhopalosiphum maidis]